MIKLKYLILENQHQLNKEMEKDAFSILRLVWKITSKDDKFDTEQIRLWIDNEEDIQNKTFELSKKYFSHDDESYYKFIDYIITLVEKLEHQYNQRRGKKIDDADPTFFLRSSVVGTDWDQAKRNIKNMSLGAWGEKKHDVSDDEAEETFQRLYRNAMGETYYDLNNTTNTPRLSDIVSSDSEQSSIFVRYYAGWNVDRFPETVKVWRGTISPNAKIRPGDFVTFDREYSRSYVRGRFGAVIKDILPSKDLRVYKMDVGTSELVYWPEGHKIKPIENVPTFREFWEIHRYD